MSFDDGTETPADQSAWDELQSLYRDDSHPQHKPFWQGDQRAVSYRDELMQRAWGSGEKVIGNSSPQLEQLFREATAPAATPQDQPQESGATLLQDENAKTEQTNHEVRELLQAELGSNWENVARDAFDQVQAIGQKYGLSIDQLNDMAHDLGIASNARMQADLIRRLAGGKR